MKSQKRNPNWGVKIAKHMEQAKILIDSLTKLGRSIFYKIVALYLYSEVDFSMVKDITSILAT